MRKSWALFAIAAVIAIAVAAALWSALRGEATCCTPSGAASGAPAAGIPSPPADAFRMTVVSVHDGDTLRAVAVTPNEVVPTTDDVRVRLIGIDTPELGVECWADEATEKLAALAPVGSTVWVAADADPYDRYGRTLLYLWTPDGTFVNYTLVVDGDAEALLVEPNDAHAELFAAAEEAARETGAGQWSACG